MRLFFSPYEIQSKHRPNSQAETTLRQGVLLKIEWGGERIGYADLHVWTQFGDAPWADQLEGLARGRVSATLSQALAFASADAQARRHRRSLFAGLALPQTHALISDLSSCSPKELAARGFLIFKIKMGRDLDEETSVLKRWMQLSHLRNIRFRVDFNGALSVEEYVSWRKRWSPEEWSRFDLIEDPVATEGATLPDVDRLAADFVDDARFGVRIVKPARQDIWECWPAWREKRIIFTHSMDHPLGQAAALWTAARFYRRYPQKAEVCGFSADGPRLRPSVGTGFGFDEFLKDLKWEAWR